VYKVVINDKMTQAIADSYKIMKQGESVAESQGPMRQYWIYINGKWSGYNTGAGTEENPRPREDAIKMFSKYNKYEVPEGAHLEALTEREHILRQSGYNPKTDHHGGLTEPLVEEVQKPISEAVLTPKEYLDRLEKYHDEDGFELADESFLPNMTFRYKYNGIEVEVTALHKNGNTYFSSYEIGGYNSAGDYVVRGVTLSIEQLKTYIAATGDNDIEFVGDFNEPHHGGLTDPV